MQLTLIEVLQSDRRRDGAWLFRFLRQDGGEAQIILTLKCAGEVKMALWE